MSEVRELKFRNSLENTFKLFKIYFVIVNIMEMGNNRFSFAENNRENCKLLMKHLFSIYLNFKKRTKHESHI